MHGRTQGRAIDVTLALRLTLTLTLLGLAACSGDEGEAAAPSAPAEPPTTVAPTSVGPNPGGPNPGASTPASQPGVARPVICGEPPFLGGGGVQPPEGEAEALERLVSAHPDALTGVWWDGATESWELAVPSAGPDVDALVAGAVPAGTPVRIVEVGRSFEELAVVQQRLGEALASRALADGTSIRVWDGTVEVNLRVRDDASLAAVAELAGSDLAAVCVTGADPATVIPPGPQQPGGDGWQLLAAERGAGSPYDTNLATNQEAYDALWRELGLAGGPPPVSFDESVVVHFGATYGSSCPDIRLDGIVSDEAARLVHAVVVLPGGDRACTADANPLAFVVALDRELLPPVPFRIQLSEAVVCAGCDGSEVTEVTEL